MEADANGCHVGTKVNVVGLDEEHGAVVVVGTAEAVAVAATTAGLGGDICHGKDADDEDDEGSVDCMRSTLTTTTSITNDDISHDDDDDDDDSKELEGYGYGDDDGNEKATKRHGGKERGEEVSEPAEETPAMICDKLREMEDAVCALPEEERAGWEKAVKRCKPSMVDDDHRLMFLRCECFHAERAAKRLARYWSKRLDLFGPDRAYLPLTLGGALRDDIDALLVGFVRANDKMVDSHGRKMLFLDPSLLLPQNRLRRRRLHRGEKDTDHYDDEYHDDDNDSHGTHHAYGRDTLGYNDDDSYNDDDDHDHDDQHRMMHDRRSVNRATWYVVHAILENDIEAQRRGIVLLTYPFRAAASQFDARSICDDIDSLRGCIPVRVCAVHVCHPPLFAHVALPVVRLLIGPKMGRRLHVHCGRKEEVIAKLIGGHGIPRRSVPCDMGGQLVLNQDLWLAERRVAGL